MNNSPQKLIIIAGMHRSGTSLLSCILHHLGVDLGEDLIPAPKEDNSLGYWEPQKVVDLHEEFFAQVNLRSDDCDIFPANWQNNIIADNARSQINSWLEQFSGEGLVSVKDPRICRFLPFWVMQARQQNYQPVFIIPIRNPLEIAQSLAKRGEEYQYLQYSLMWWLVSVLEAERHSRNFPRICYQYPDLIKDWRDITGRIAVEFNIKWSVDSNKINGEIDKIISPQLHRNRCTSDELKAIDQLGWASQAYDIMTNWAENTPLDTKKLDDIYKKVTKFLRPLSGQDLTPHGSSQEIQKWENAIKKQKARWW